MKLQYQHLQATPEGATTTQNHNYPYNLTSVTYDLEWEEDEELDSPDNPVVGTLFPDDFSLGISTNYVFNLSDNGTSNNLELNLTYYLLYLII